jgi:hypothetical protein
MVLFKPDLKTGPTRRNTRILGAKEFVPISVPVRGISPVSGSLT